MMHHIKQLLYDNVYNNGHPAATWVASLILAITFAGIVGVELCRRHRYRVRYRITHYTCKKCSNPLRLRHLPVKVPNDYSRSWLMRWLSMIDYLSQPQGVCEHAGCAQRGRWVLPDPERNLSAVKQWAFWGQLVRFRQLQRIGTVEDLILQKEGPDICYDFLQSRRLLPVDKPSVEGKNSLYQFFMTRRAPEEFPPPHAAAK